MMWRCKVLEAVKIDALPTPRLQKTTRDTVTRLIQEKNCKWAAFVSWLRIVMNWIELLEFLKKAARKRPKMASFLDSSLEDPGRWWDSRFRLQPLWLTLSFPNVSYLSTYVTFPSDINVMLQFFSKSPLQTQQNSSTLCSRRFRGITPPGNPSQAVK